MAELVSEQFIAFGAFAVFGVLAVIILLMLFFQNGGLENCSCATPKTNMVSYPANNEEEVDSPSSPERPKSREAWAEAAVAESANPTSPKQRAKQLPPELEDPDR